VQNKKTTWIDKTAQVQHKKDNLDKQNSMLHWCCFVYPGCLCYVALVLFYLSWLSFLFCTGAVLFIQVVFFMLHWCCLIYPGYLFYVALEKDNLDRQNSTSAT
jgi:hypothetical protein